MTDDVRPADDVRELQGLVEVWWRAVGDLLDLLDEVPDEQWDTPTDLPGWRVHDVVAHVAHLESVLAGAPESTADVGSPPHVRGPMGVYCEQGVVDRRDRTPDQLRAEVREATRQRLESLRADPPSDGADRPPVGFSGVGWGWRTLLRNRPLDVWMHEQDVRRAVARPGGLHGPAADHAIGYLAEGLGFVVGKRVGAAPGTGVVLEVDGAAPVAVVVDDDGRARRTEPPADPTVRLLLTRAAFVVLAGGRRAPEPADVVVEGDRALGDRVLASLATTP